MNVSDCYSAMHRGVAKINSELVALRLLYIVMPITKLEKKLKVFCFLRAGHICVIITSQFKFVKRFTCFYIF